ncbi:type IV pilus secretin PilQ, partial [Variovorax sp. 2RAF20]
NTLIISDIPKKIAQMKELIHVIDRPVDQVLIEARVVIATDTFARDLGAKFGISGASGKAGDRSSVGLGGSADASSANANSRADAVQN